MLLACILLPLVVQASATPWLSPRPGLYFGLRETTPLGSSLSLSWQSPHSSSSLRHDARDGELTRFGFVESDGESYNSQILQDSTFTLTTEHVLVSSNSALVRMNGTGTGEWVNVFVTLAGEEVVVVEDATREGVRGEGVEARAGMGRMEVRWGGRERKHGSGVCTEHTTRVRAGKTSPELERTHFVGWREADGEKRWRVAERISKLLRDSVEIARRGSVWGESGGGLKILPVLPNQVEPRANVVTFQRSLTLPFSFTITYTKNTLKSDSVPTAIFDEKKFEFNQRFAKAFPHLVTSYPAEQVDMAKAALSNCLGSIGYFYGSVILDDGTLSSPGSLITGVPSRSFFPRGFFWDEGFHQLLISKFAPDVAKRVLSSWMSRFESSGWVAREQILGAEALERVPVHFQRQNRTFANPPTLLLAVESLLLKNTTEQVRGDLVFYTKVLEVFTRHCNWLDRTQASVNFAKQGLMAWKGRSLDGEHTLTSGIDDYPRGAGGFLNHEAHVDLLSWSAWESCKLGELAQALGKDSNSFANSCKTKSDLLMKYHWNDGLGFFNDLGVNLGRAGNSGFIPHVGYVGLMPFLLKLIPTTDVSKLERILKWIADNDALRAEGVGLRSLSKSDKLFSKGEDYWRGAVWLNMNYLCIRALVHYSRACEATHPNFAKKALETAQALKSDVIANVYKQYRDQGYLFENYDANTGHGRGTRPFTGWTTLVVLLMEEQDV